MSMETSTTSALLEPGDLRRLEGLQFAPRRRFAGVVRGERISKQKGISLEFADYREYTPGDDLRHLDWSILGRLNRATIRTYQDEDDLAVYILLDTSPSMDFGVPVKFDHARMCAAALGFIGLIGQDAVRPIALGTTGARPMRTLRGRGSYHALADWITGRRAEGTESYAAGLMRFATGSHRTGLAVCITDGLDPEIVDAVRAAGARGFEVVFIQVLAPAELAPDLEGDLRLLDAETGEPIEVTAHAETIESYRRNLAGHCAAIEAATVRSGGRYARTVTTDSLEDFLAGAVRRTGLAK